MIQAVKGEARMSLRGDNAEVARYLSCVRRGGSEAMVGPEPQ